jgi:hypothetical protein
MANADRLKALLTGFIRAVTRQVDYCARYPCTVAGQNADGTLELVPDSPKFVGLSKVKYRPGIPGATLTVASGTRVLLGFDNADPSKPYAEGWDQVGTVTELDVNATLIKLNSGTNGVARNGDSTTNGTLAMTQVPDGGGTGIIITFTYTPPVGSPLTVGTIHLLTAGGTATAGTSAIAGQINSSSASVKCG